jgi:hypothetical protein
MTGNSGGGKGGLLWLVYFALIIAGTLLLADAFHFRVLTKLSVRLGVALLFTAIALMAGKDKPAGIISIAIVWIAIIIVFLN